MKRFFDIIFSFFGLIFLSPFLCVLALFIVFESRGGIFYLQTRVGMDNKDFRLFKFRTMYVNSEKKGFLTIGNRDPRITRCGVFIRKYKFDEFAQLINVLKGDMSLVGPRPEVRKYVDMYSVEQMDVLSVKPGITDYASIVYSNENEILANSQDPESTYINVIMPHKLELNLRYIADQSIVTDVKIIINTLIKIFR